METICRDKMWLLDGIEDAKMSGGIQEVGGQIEMRSVTSSASGFARLGLELLFRARSGISRSCAVQRASSLSGECIVLKMIVKV